MIAVAVSGRLVPWSWFQALEAISPQTRNLLNRLILLSNRAAKYPFVLGTKGYGMK